ncbi:hypothetical protein [Candidatus Williamhamiltonella defendens]|uniref:hypothetical protein n=1 Tax=Candidatus Williamhamiltonella defendens TaxID=138072 RepID=UPI0016519F0C|nr:hypothetical protein [Candidatus Hamiltonella defensa]
MSSSIPLTPSRTSIYLDNTSMKGIHFNANTLNYYFLNLDQKNMDWIPSIQFLKKERL